MEDFAVYHLLLYELFSSIYREKLFPIHFGHFDRFLLIQNLSCWCPTQIEFHLQMVFFIIFSPFHSPSRTSFLYFRWPYLCSGTELKWIALAMAYSTPICLSSYTKHYNINNDLVVIYFSKENPINKHTDTHTQGALQPKLNQNVNLVFWLVLEKMFLWNSGEDQVFVLWIQKNHENAVEWRLWSSLKLLYAFTLGF